MESPGGTEALRAAASDWSLAGDRQLLGLLQNIHQNIMSRCEETSGRLGEMAASLDSASVSLQNVNNRFMALSNSQFIESRVYEDDTEVSTDAAPAHPKDERPLSPYRSPFELGISTIERLHTPTDILRDTDSSSDDEAERTTILIPKSVYGDRPLPYIIGSFNWNNKRHAGLISTSESGSDTDTDRGSRTPTRSGNHSGSDLEARLAELNAVPRTVSSSSSERGVPAVGQASAKGDVASRLSQSVVAAELARRLGNIPIQERRSTSSAEEDVLPISRHLHKPHQPTSVNVFPDEPPPLLNNNYSDDEHNSFTDGDDDIFAEINKTAPYANKHKSDNNVDLFDDNSFIGRKVEIPSSNAPLPKKPTIFDDNEEPDLFKHDSRDIGNENNDTENDTKQIKKPLGAVSLFGTNQTAQSIGEAIMNRNKRSPCSSHSSDECVVKKDNSTYYEILPKNTKEEPKPKSILDELFNNSKKSPKPSISSTKPTISSTKPTSSPEKIVNKEFNQKVDKKHDLFNDSIFDDADIFSKNKSENVTAKVKATSKPLFDDVDNNTSSRNIPKLSSKSVKTRSTTLFDDVENNTFSTNKPKDIPQSVKATTMSQFDNVDNKTFSTNDPKDTPKSVKTISTSLFDDDDEYIFSTKRHKDTPKNIITTNTSLFDDVDTYISSKNKPELAPKSVIMTKTSLFDDVDDTIFSTNQPTVNINRVITTNTSLFDDVDDLFINVKVNKIHSDKRNTETDDNDDVLSEILYTGTGNDKIPEKPSTKVSTYKIDNVFDNNQNSSSNEIKDSLKNEEAKLFFVISGNDFNSDQDKQKELAKTASDDLYDDDQLFSKQIKTKQSASNDLYNDELVSDKQKEPKIAAFYDHDDDDLFANIRLPNLNVLQSKYVEEEAKKNVETFTNKVMKINLNEMEKEKKMLQDKRNAKSQLIEKPALNIAKIDKSYIFDSVSKIEKETNTIQNEIKEKHLVTIEKTVDPDEEVDNWHLVKAKTESLWSVTEPSNKDTKPIVDWVLAANKTSDKNDSFNSEILKTYSNEKKGKSLERVIEKSLPSTEKPDLIIEKNNKNSSILDSDNEINGSPKKEKTKSMERDTEPIKKDDKPIKTSANSELPKSKIAVKPTHNNDGEEGVGRRTLDIKSYDIFDPDYDESEKIKELKDEEREKMRGLKNIETFDALDAYNKMITTNQIVNRSKHHETPQESTKTNEAQISFIETFPDQPPAFEKPKEKRKNININALFDDDSEDEALFLRKPEIFDDKPHTNSITTKPLYPIFADEPPAIDADNKANSLRTIEQIISSENLSKCIVENLDDSINSKPKTVGKLKPVNFNINVMGLLPGTSPKKVAENEFSPPESPELPKDIKTKSRVIVQSVSFDSDPDSTVLDNKISKERVKIQVKRRPSTRRARIEAARKSTIEIAADMNTNDRAENELLQNSITADSSDKFTQESEGLKETDQNVDMLHDMISVIEKFDKIVTNEPAKQSEQGVVKKYNIADIAREDGETTQILNINDDDVYVLKNSHHTKADKSLLEDKIDNEEIKEGNEINTIGKIYDRKGDIPTKKLSNLINEEMKEEEGGIQTLEKGYDCKKDILAKKLNTVENDDENFISITKRNTLEENHKKITTSTTLVPENIKSILPEEISDEIFILDINEDKKKEKRSADLDEIVHEYDKTSAEIEKYDKQTDMDNESEKRNTTITQAKTINLKCKDKCKKATEKVKDTKSTLKTVEVIKQSDNKEEYLPKSSKVNTFHSTLSTFEVTKTPGNKAAEDPDLDELKITSAEIEKYDKKSDIDDEIFENEIAEVKDNKKSTEDTTKFVSEAAFSRKEPKVKETEKSLSNIVEHTKEPVVKLSVLPKAPTKTLFGDLSDDDEDLFKSKKRKPKETVVTNVFSNDSDDGLFVQKLIVKKKEHQKRDNVAVAKKPLFDDESSDDLFSHKPKNSAEHKKTKQKSRRSNSKDRIFLPKKMVEPVFADPLSLFDTDEDD